MKPPNERSKFMAREVPARTKARAGSLVRPQSMFGGLPNRQSNQDDLIQ
jgi:hypothetical protein